METGPLFREARDKDAELRRKLQEQDNKIRELQERRKTLEAEFSSPEARKRRMDINAKILVVSEQIQIERDCRDVYQRKLDKMVAAQSPASPAPEPAPSAAIETGSRRIQIPPSASLHIRNHRQEKKYRNPYKDDEG